jgi:hypothetical protein
MLGIWYVLLCFCPGCGFGGRNWDLGLTYRMVDAD